ncbi:hypothetical protein AGABI2DRAFT_220643 [Agaricus bisporus var. bisporus H97]|uniref:hypothetical protein n=1 Tax=Agaricus bisporus var. bisporus (strain H97 / ATCC MYA-4626 / FGSC 10389) TaxID=936046 RepID=UPI00029F63A6|nr:hypothetical protein AGABI2DRAFT_220643 [Agaricus bisporus var. bisporus H97]EKV48715.1 hypothetical protein AGABI2DRAFT_220643 [Agaricus bisporus var. bisporus H97]
MSRYRTIPQIDDDPGSNDVRADQPFLSSRFLSGDSHITSLTNKGSFTTHPDGSYTYAYGPGGLRGLKHNYYALLCALFASIGGLEFGYDQGVIANVLVMKDFRTSFPLTPIVMGTMTAVLELGCLFGVLCAGVFADRYSRRMSILFACIVFCIGSAFQCGATSLPHLYIGRAIGGVGVGALRMLSPLYMAEISPPEVRGSLLTLEQFSIVLRVPNSLSWRIPLGIQIIPGIVLAVGCFFLPPSPRLLILQGRNDDALASLAKLRLRTLEEAKSDPLIQIELLEMRAEKTLISRTSGNECSTTVCIGELRSWGQLFKPRYRDRTMVGIMIMFFQQWSGINALLYYGPILVHSIGLSSDTNSLAVSGGIGIVQFLAVFITIIYIDKLGRKPLLRGGSIIMASSHITIAVLIYIFEDEWSSHPAAVWAAVGGMYTFTFAYGVSFGPIGWVLPSEVFPISMRGKGIALSTASNWFNNFLIGLITPVLVEMSPSITFIVFAVPCLLAYFWATHQVPETANLSLEEIDAVFNSSVGSDDANLKRQIEQDLGLHDLIQELVANDGH